MVFFIILSSIFFIALLASIYVCFRFGKLLMNIEDNGDFCIEYIEKRYQKISDMVNKHPILHLDPIVIKYVNEIKKLNDDMVVVATAMTESSDLFRGKIRLLEEKDNEKKSLQEKNQKVSSVLDLIETE